MRNALIGASVLAALAILIAGGQVMAQDAPDTACHTFWSACSESRLWST
jgi:hypothetical protein